MKKILLFLLISSVVFTEKSNAQTALDFDGVNDKVDCGNSINLVLNTINTISIEAWVKSSTLTGSGAFIGNWNGSNLQFLLKRDGSEFSMFANSTALTTTGGQALLNTWQHIAGTWDGSFMRIYVNGVEVANQSYAAASFNTMTNTVNIGYNNGIQLMTGALDDIRLWSTVRTPAEITANMNTCLLGTETGLVALYDFENGTSSSLLTDVTGNGHDGTLTNMDPGTDWVTGVSCAAACIIDQSIFAAQSTFMCSGSTTIDVVSSEIGVDYYLRDDADDSIIYGPVAGTGSAISFNTGTISATTTYNVYADKTNSVTTEALEFTGNSGLKKVSLGTAIWDDNFSGTNQLTVEAWVKRASAGSLHTILGNYEPGSYPFLFRIDSDRIAFWMNNTTNITGATVIPTATWTHVAATYDGSNIRLYVNGVLDATLAYSANFIASTNDVKIGGGLSSTEYFPGDIADVRIWNSVRTDAQIAANKDAFLTGNESGLIANYQFTEGSGISAANSALGNAYPGTLVNSPAWVAGPTLIDLCTLEMTQTATVTINQITDQPVSAAQSSFMCSGSTTIDLASSEVGINYYLRDSVDNSIIAGPITGTGSAISFNTGTISTSITYNVYAEDADSSGALFFEEDPTNKYVQLATDPLNGTTSLTVEMWIKPDINAGSNIGYVPLFGHVSGANRCWISSNGSIAWKADNGSTFLGSLPGGVAFDGNWHHIAIVYDDALPSGSKNKIYVDGISIALSINNDFGGWNAPVPLRIGNHFASQDYNYDGEMDEFRMWSIARSQVEIQSNMDAVAPSSTGLLAYYNFEDGTGSSTLTDISGNGHNGTLVNHDVNTDWTTKTSVNCSLEMIVTPTVTINSITDQGVTAAQSTFMCSGDTTIDVASSEIGVDYYLRDNADDSVISGPIAGTGGAIAFNTGTISASTTYNVYAEKTEPGIPTVYDFNMSGLPAGLTSVGPNTWGVAQAGTGVLSGEQVLVLQGATADVHRSYVKTIATDFINKDFSIEVLHNQNGSGGNSIFFFGIGDPGAGGSEPTDGIYTRFHPSGLEGADMLANSSTSPSLWESLFNLIGQGNGLSRIKMEKTGDILQFFIDVNNTGTYVQYGSDIDVSTSNFDYLDATNSSVFIGTGASLSQFDDLTISSSVVTCSLEMTVTPIITINAVDASTNRVDDIITANNAAATSYQWVDCNNSNAPIPTEANQSFTATAVGSYAVEVTQNGCTVTSACVNIATLGVFDDVFGAGIKLYPNPTTGNFTLSFDESMNDTTVTIVNIIGKEVYAIQNVNNKTLPLKINHFSNGVYFVKIQNNNQQKVIKLIKQ